MRPKRLLKMMIVHYTIPAKWWAMWLDLNGAWHHETTRSMALCGSVWLTVVLCLIMVEWTFLWGDTVMGSCGRMVRKVGFWSSNPRTGRPDWTDLGHLTTKLSPQYVLPTTPVPSPISQVWDDGLTAKDKFICSHFTVCETSKYFHV